MGIFKSRLLLAVVTLFWKFFLRSRNYFGIVRWARLSYGLCKSFAGLTLNYGKLANLRAVDGVGVAAASGVPIEDAQGRRSRKL